jgi:predicted nucleic acid-binding protein
LVGVKNRVYLDTSIIAVWIITEEEPTKISQLPKKAENAKKLLDSIIAGKLNCRLQTSDWALSEMIQVLRDRAIFKKFFFDGFEFFAFNRLKSEYKIEQIEREIIQEAMVQFEKFLKKIGVEFIKIQISWRKIHEYCLKYSLETPDAAHLLIALEHSDYLVTNDKAFKEAGVTDVVVIDPADLITRKELLFQ